MAPGFALALPMSVTLTFRKATRTGHLSAHIGCIGGHYYEGEFAQARESAVRRNSLTSEAHLVLREPWRRPCWPEQAG